jgi:hypothetical protein
VMDATAAQTISAIAACCSAAASALATLAALRSIRLAQAERERESRRRHRALLGEIQTALNGLAEAFARHEYGMPLWQERLNRLNLALLLSEEDLPATFRLTALTRPPSDSELREASAEVRQAVRTNATEVQPEQGKRLKSNSSDRMLSSAGQPTADDTET